ncbi:HDOD domain-containing protein [Halopseudomonas sp.]|uniref:HDOD domain-containing protein n=1 Tax=Halopseudomonas sp. TaxID=2901191 RepID=UPI003562C1C2
MKSASDQPVDERIEQAFMGMVLGVHSPQNKPLNDFERRALKAFSALLDSDLADNRLIPRLPSVLPRLMSYFRDPSTTSKELAQLIEQDIVSVSEVIRLANSPFYRRASEARSLEQAVLVLGERGLRQMVANLLVRPIFSERQGHFSAIAGLLLWEQSGKTALIASALARQEQGDEFNAYLAGISSNLGLLIGCRVLDRLFDGSQTPSSLAFRAQWLGVARQLTARVARAWEFPAATCAVLTQLGRLEPSRLPPEAMRLYSAQRLSQFQGLQSSGRLPAADPTQSGLNIADDRVYDLAMDILARLDGRKG